MTRQRRRASTRAVAQRLALNIVRDSRRSITGRLPVTKTVGPVPMHATLHVKKGVQGNMERFIRSAVGRAPKRIDAPVD